MKMMMLMTHTNLLSGVNKLLVPHVPQCSAGLEQGFSIWAKGLLSVLYKCS
jgi:hypothetical protein